MSRLGLRVDGAGAIPTLVCFGVRRDDRLRFGGEAVPTRGQSDLSLLERPAPAPLFLRRGESEAF
jgi:hypothetical protein